MIQSDHKPLSYIRHAEQRNDRLHRWSIFLSQFDFEIEHIPGTQNAAADFFSRVEPDFDVNAVTRGMTQKQTVESDKTDRPNPKTPTFEDILSEDVTVLKPDLKLALERENLKQYQKDDPFIADIIDKLKNPTQQTKTQSVFFVEHDIVKRHWFNKGSQKLVSQTVIPSELVAVVLHQFHGASIAGHFGVEKVTGTILLRYWWPKISQDVSDWIQSCPICQLSKKERTPKVPMISIPITGPWDMVAVDCLSIKPSRSGNCNVVVFCDYFTK